MYVHVFRPEVCAGALSFAAYALPKSRAALCSAGSALRGSPVGADGRMSVRDIEGALGRACPGARRRGSALIAGIYPGANKPLLAGIKP
jgi:hypothetical protein